MPSAVDEAVELDAAARLDGGEQLLGRERAPAFPLGELALRRLVFLGEGEDLRR